MIQLTYDQKAVHDAAVYFAFNGRDFISIGGLAGTGKTTVTAEIVKTLRRRPEGITIAFCCYTGKAASVLRSKLIAAECLTQDEYCGTIHGLIYEPIVKKHVVIGWRRKQMIDADLIVVDEASMLNESIWDDLRRYGIPIIVIGDHGQLPPIEGAFNLMKTPNYTLTKVHRQAEHNPIIKLSMIARETGDVPFGVFGDGVSKVNLPNDAILRQLRGNLMDVLFLSGLNRTRKTMNALIRGHLGFGDGIPKPGEKVICLKNNRELAIYNGVGGLLKEYEVINDTWAYAKVRMETGNDYEGNVIHPQFGQESTLKEWPGIRQKELRDLFDFGYCLTVHKAQGSEADFVVLMEERFSRMDDDQWRRWLYTGITRAKSKLLIVGRRWDQKGST